MKFEYSDCLSPIKLTEKSHLRLVRNRNPTLAADWLNSPFHWLVAISLLDVGKTRFPLLVAKITILKSDFGKLL